MIDSNFLQRTNQSVARFFPKVCIKTSAEELLTYVWDGGAWAVDEVDASALSSPFRQVVWLIAEERTHYRIRRFPSDSVKKADLSEAIFLDLDLWSPGGGQSGVFFLPVLNQNEWVVSVWVWDAQAEEKLQFESDISSSVTHVMPEQAWQFATVSEVGPVLLMWKSRNSYTYGYMDESNVPCSISSVSSERDAKLYWRGLGGLTAKVESVLFLDEEMNPPWLPQDIAKVESVACLPSSSLLSRASLPGVRDWKDPFAWKKPLIAVAFLLICWVVGSSFAIWRGEAMVGESSAQAEVQAGEVIEHRNQVADLKMFIEQVYTLRYRQKAMVQLISDLSRILPKDIWLLSIQYENNGMSLRGQGKDVARLGPLLEKIPGVVHVAHQADIRTDVSTGLELFSIRLQLKWEDSQ